MRNKIIFWIMTSLMLLVGFTLPAYAFTNKVTVSILVEVITQSIPKPKTGVKFTLEALDNAPISQNKECVVQAGQRAVMPSIDFDRVGTYTYRLRAQSEDGNKAVIKGINDFRVQITIYNGDTSLQAAIVASDWNASMDQEPKEPIQVTLETIKPSTSSKHPNTSVSNVDPQKWIYLMAGSAFVIAALLINEHMDKKNEKL